MKKDRFFIVLLILLLLFMIYFGYFSDSVKSAGSFDPIAALLGLSALVATVCGLALAIYGYVNIAHAEKIIDKKLGEIIPALKKDLAEDNLKIQEASQKMIAGYNAQFHLHDMDTAISLYEEATRVFPGIYNGYTALAYAHNQKGDKVKAREYFEKARESHPDSYQCVNDLARFNAENGEFINAISYARKTLEIKPDEWRQMDSDPAFDALKNSRKDEWTAIIEKAKKMAGVI